MRTLPCLKCHEAMALNAERKAGISIFVMGDEYLYSYWECASCQQWTIESYHDRFLGESSVHCLGPFSPEVGTECVRLVQACPHPGDKNCECASHHALYYGVPRS